MGIKSEYEDPLARAVTGHKMTGEVHGSASCEEPPEAFFCFMMGIGFLLLEVIVPLMLILFIVVPLKHIISAMVGIAFSFLYYFSEFTVFYTEKFFSTLSWAGKKWAWALVCSVPILVCTLVGLFLFDRIGLALGAFTGAMLGAIMASNRGGHMFQGADSIIPGVHSGVAMIYGSSILVSTTINLLASTKTGQSAKPLTLYPYGSRWQ